MIVFEQSPPAPAPFGFVFDIDGTLAVSSSAQLDALAQAATWVLGVPTEFTMTGEVPLLNGTPVAGWVDAQVFGHVAASIGKTWADVADDVLDVYEALYLGMLSNGASAGTLLPGVEAMLDRLAETGAPMALATGNASPIARAKMTALGVDHHFSFGPDLGFGDRHPDRTALGAAAVAHVRGRIAAEGSEAARVYLTGDTLADIASARANDAWAVGVATGAATGPALLDAGAHVVLADVTEVLGLTGLGEGRWFPRHVPGIVSAADLWMDAGQR